MRDDTVVAIMAAIMWAGCYDVKNGPVLSTDQAVRIARKLIDDVEKQMLQQRIDEASGI